ncbi:MAG: CRISPR-associated endonuclease Cas2 [Desulfosudaceae bacterium]
MRMIVAYDISDPKRLQRVAKVMKDFGVRVQKSIFEVSLSSSAFRQMKARLEEEIQWESDGVKYFPLCERCESRLEIIGQGIFVDPDQEFYVL